MLSNGRFQEILDQINSTTSSFDSIHQDISRELEAELKELANIPLEEEEYDVIKAFRSSLEIEGNTYQVYYGCAINQSMEHTSISIQYIFDHNGKEVNPDSVLTKQLLEILHDKIAEQIF